RALEHRRRRRGFERGDAHLGCSLRHPTRRRGEFLAHRPVEDLLLDLGFELVESRPGLIPQLLELDRHGRILRCRAAFGTTESRTFYDKRPAPENHRLAEVDLD